MHFNAFAAFGAYDPAVWTMQWILQNLGYDVGPTGTDGLWGSNTAGAVSDFRQIEGLPPASDWTKAALADSDFNTALWGAALNAGLDVPTAPGGAARPGTSAVVVTSRSGGGGATVTPVTPTPTPTPTPTKASLGSTGVLMAAGVGLLAIAAFGGKKKRRR